jgi:glycosyltransferase involved in cell wall biosynthesis
MNKKTLLTVAPYFPPHQGGLERYAYEVARGVQANGAYRVIVLTTSETGVESIETQGDVTIHRLPFSVKLSNSPFSFGWFFSLFRMLRTVRPDLIHIHTPVPGLGDLVAIIADMKIPLVVTYHSGSMRKGVWYLDAVIWLYEHTMMRVLLALADKVVCSSEHVQKEFLPFVLEKSSVITPAVDSELFSPCAEQKVRDTVTLMAVGGLAYGEEYKGLGRLIDMVARMQKEFPSLRLVVAGEGSARGAYEVLVRERGLEKCITFIGRQDTRGMVDAYQASDVFVLPTSNDSYPTVLLEAMAVGIPVVSTTVGSIGSIVEHGVTGFLVDPSDMAGFEAHVRALVSDSELRINMGRASREQVCARYAWRTAVEQYEALYATLCDPLPTIAHVVGYYPPHVGGMEVVAKECAETLAKRGYSVRVYTSRLGVPHGQGTKRQEGLVVHRLFGMELAHTPLLWTLPLRLLCLPRGSVLHVHVAQAYIPEIAVLVSLVRRFPLVMQFHLDVEPSGKLRFLFPYYKRYILGAVLRVAHRVLVFSEEQATFVHETYGVKREHLRIVENGVAEVYRFQARTEVKNPTELLFVGRLSVQKRVDRLLHAVAKVQAPIRLTIVGDGPCKAELVALTQRLGLRFVRFMGDLSPKGVRKQYRNADVFILPSDKEGMPLVVLEAMMSGLPVIGTDVPGIRELVRDVGVLVEPAPEALAHAIERVLSDPAVYKKLSAQSVARIESHTWGSVVDRLEDVYRGVGNTKTVL